MAAMKTEIRPEARDKNMKGFARLAGGTALLALLTACSSQPQTAAIPEGAEVQDLYIVDCLLPGQLRQLGGTTYMTPRRPVRTTAGDCRIRGGEYTAYDRADYKTALKVWLPAAEGGDAEAQNTVGEIFEQGLGTDPNYAVAAMWYRRAAEQGFKTAQFNLGTLYETGKGVEQDKLQALNWYRKAWGINDDELAYRSEAEQQILAAAEENASLQQQLAEVEARVAVASERGQQVATEYREIQEDLEEAQAELAAVRENLPPPEEVTATGKNFGRYYALMIGNGEYRYLDDLATPVSDVQRLSGVLQERYGFQVRVITNGDDASVLRAINRLNDELTEDDNLLIYYAGHSNQRTSGDYVSGYWLPVNAEPPPEDTFWIPTEQVSGHMARLKARRIIVIADSAYAGLLAENPAFLLASDPAQLNSEAYVALRFPNRSRLLMTSGKEYPLPEEGDGSVSVFADAMIDALLSNKRVLTAPALFLTVTQELEERRPELQPEFKAIKRAGDEVGEFFFVARQ